MRLYQNEIRGNTLAGTHSRQARLPLTEMSNHSNTDMTCEAVMDVMMIDDGFRDFSGEAIELHRWLRQCDSYPFHGAEED